MRSISQAKPLPPFGRAHLIEQRSSGPWVAVGADAWAYTRAKPFPVMVLPPGDDPAAYWWPVAGDSVVLVQHGDAEPASIEKLMLELLRSGATLVVAIGLPSASKYGYPETTDVAS